MAGYNGLSKSWNAIDAENQGLMTATAAGKYLGVSSAAIKEFLTPKEWHHTSKHYNETDYYLVRLEEWDQGEIEAALEVEHVIELVPTMKAWDQARRLVSATVHENCTVEWLEWSGTRNHPHCAEREAKGCSVSIKGQTATITFVNGSTMTKRLNTRGFRWREVTSETEKKI